MLRVGLPRHAMFCIAVRCCNVLKCKSSLRNATSCYDIQRYAVLFYAMLCRALRCIAHPLGIVALLDTRLCE
eukprot:5445717-Pyramimonas_sp.AAC.1